MIDAFITWTCIGICKRKSDKRFSPHTKHTNLKILCVTKKKNLQANYERRNSCNMRSCELALTQLVYRTTETLVLLSFCPNTAKFKNKFNDDHSVQCIVLRDTAGRCCVSCLRCVDWPAYMVTPSIESNCLLTMRWNESIPWSFTFRNIFVIAAAVSQCFFFYYKLQLMGFNYISCALYYTSHKRCLQRFVISNECNVYTYLCRCLILTPRIEAYQKYRLMCLIFVVVVVAHT